MNRLTSSQRKLLIISAVLLALGLVGFLVYRASTFHIVRVTPKMSQVSKVSPYIKLYFNNELKKDSLRISDPGSIFSETTVDGKVVTLYFEENLTTYVDYSFTLRNIENKSGEAIKNTRFEFSPNDSGYDDLPKEQQQALVDRQDERIYEVSQISYERFDALLDYGLTAGQLENIKLLLYDYSNIAKKQFWTMTVSSGSIVVADHDPNSANTLEKMDFTVELGDVNYNAHAEYDAFYDSVHLILRSADGVLVYDSANSAD